MVLVLKMNEIINRMLKNLPKFYTRAAVLLMLGIALISVRPPQITSQESIINLVVNGDFETGDLSAWEEIGNTTIDSQDQHAGTFSAHVTDSSTPRQGWIEVTPGKTYVATAWFKWVAMSDSDWGSSRFTVNDGDFQEIGGISNLDQRYEQNIWNKIAFTFVPATDLVMVSFGVFGPESTIDLYFDDIMLFEKTSNVPAEIQPEADVISGTPPLIVSFSANADDSDGAVALYQWTFGDGAEARTANAEHTYVSQGTFTATLNAFDNDGAKSSQNLVITVTDPQAPQIEISAPSSTELFTTADAVTALSGTTHSDSSPIASVVWDNVSSGDAGEAPLTPSLSVGILCNPSPPTPLPQGARGEKQRFWDEETVPKTKSLPLKVAPLAYATEGGGEECETFNWAVEAIPLKPGENEILITATDAEGKVATDRIWITRSIDAPSIENISTNTTTPRVYEKYEVTFDVTTIAEQYMFMYDPDPPEGVEHYSGVTVEGVIMLPDGEQVTHPAFYFEGTTRVGNIYELTGEQNWKLRYSPQQTGVHQVSLRVTDQSGTVTTPVGSFTAEAPIRPGFIQVSEHDPRYFEYSNGTLHWPIGMTWTGAEIPENGEAPSVINYDRPWMAGRGAWSANWARWKSSAEQHGNEGRGIHYSILEHYPGSEISQYIHTPDGSRMWISCFLDEDFCAQIESGRTYQVKLRVKTQGINGPAQADLPYGLVIKNHDWPPDDFEREMRSAPSWIPMIDQDKDWHTIVTRVTAQNDSDDFTIYLDNVTAGEAFVDEFSIREVLADGSLGPEQIRNPRADWHTYVEQRPMAAFDEAITTGETNGINLRYVVHDKNDRLINSLTAYGVFADFGGGYYQPENTKATWLQKQWWRYLVARLGYSTAVFGWELNNEGPPDDGTGSHARTAQIFARWVHELDAHPHLANTSFWCCWEPTFWGDDSQFPDVDFGDIHHYGPATDMVQWYLDEAIPVISSQVGKPVVRGETGIMEGSSTNDPDSSLLSPNPGIWYHNMLWSQLHYSAMFEIGYWYSEHGEAIIGGRTPHARAFANFVHDLDLNAGGYEDIAATSDQAKFRILGQKNIAKNSAHGWINHSDHTWKNVMDYGVPAAVSGTVSFSMNPNTFYTVSWYDTYSGSFIRVEQIITDASGNLTLSVENLSADVAFKID